MRERVREIVDFVTSTSPYKNANQGWLSDDIYLQVGGTSESSSKEGQEFIDVFIFWEPLKKLVFNLFFVVSLSLLLVASAVSYSHGKFEIPFRLPAISPQGIEINTKDLEQKVENLELMISSEEVDSIELNKNLETSFVDNENEDSPEELIQDDIEPILKKSLGTAGNLF